MKKIKVMLVDDHKIVRDGLKALIDREDHMEVIAEAENGRIAVEKCRDAAPQVVIMDVSMPDLNGIEATRKIVSENPKMRVIGLSMHADRRFVTEMLKVGACGYLLKDCAAEEMIRAIETVTQNQNYLSPRITDIVIGDYLSQLNRGKSSVFSILTAREREVLQQIAEGKSTKQVAAHFHVSIKTIETHRQHIMQKLDIKSVAELTKYAIREGLTTL